MPRFMCSPDDVKPVQARWPINLQRSTFGISPLEALNCADHTTEATDTDIAARLKEAMNALIGQGFDGETGHVYYQALADSDSFATYRALAGDLRGFNPWRLNARDERIAFWLNLYNALIIHAVIAYGVKRSINQIRGAFERAAYIIGGYRCSANDIEHGILRGNAGHPLLPGPQFDKDDPRRAWAITRADFDVRIHFALVCAARSCPAVGVYEADHLHQQLDMAAWNFINQGGVRVAAQENTVYLSRIFTFYSKDFGSGGFGQRQTGILRFIQRYLQSKEDVVFVNQHIEHLSVKAMPYDWSLND